MDHIGIDVHKKESQLCIPGAEGQLSNPRIRTTAPVKNSIYFYLSRSKTPSTCLP